MLITTPAAWGEITLDGTLGPSGPVTGPDYVIGDDLGRLRGANLFHSFGAFTINTGESATFTGPASVENVLGRVTGGSASLIDGRLSSQIPGANLYLMNPGGLMFGPNATLDISGSFHATTADYIGLEGGGRFDASTPSNSVLTTAPPAAFGFLGNNPAGISIDQGKLEVPRGETISLISGDIQIGDIQDQAENLVAPSGQINLISVASSGEAVDTTPTALDGFELQSFDSLGSIELTQSEVTTLGDPGGTIYIRSGQLSLVDGAVSGTTTGDNNHPGVGVDIAVTGDMSLKSEEDQTFVFAQVWSGGDGGDIRIRARSLQLIAENFSGIVSGSSDSGNAGDIEIDVERLEMRGGAAIIARGGVSGDGGDITITAHEVELSGGGDEGFAFITADGGFLTPETGNSGNAGNLTITADTMRLHRGESGYVGVTAQINSRAKGAPNSGDLQLNVRQLEILDGAQVSAGVLGGAGKGGTVNITSDYVLVAGTAANGAPSGIFGSNQRPFGETGVGPAGTAGDVNITTGDLEVRDGGEISVFNFGQGAAGNIDIDARSVRLIGPSPEGGTNITGISAAGGVFATDAGNIRLTVENLQVLDGAKIVSNTAGPGTGGTVDITANSVLIAGQDVPNHVPSQIGASTNIFQNFVEQATGNGGDVTVRAGTLELSDHGEITAESSSAGDSGNTTLNVDQLILNDNASITVESTNTGNAGLLDITARNSFRSDRSSVSTEAAQADGGNILLAAGRLVYLNDSEITATVGGGEGRGGNITIDPTFVVLNQSAITANAFAGPGGNILIVTDNFIASVDSAVTASSEFGVDGQVVIKSPQDNVAVGKEALPESFLDVSSLLSERCAARRETKVGSFVVLGRGGIPPGQYATLPSSYADIDLRKDTPLGTRGSGHPTGPNAITYRKGQYLVSGKPAVAGVMPARFVVRCGTNADARP